MTANYDVKRFIATGGNQEAFVTGPGGEFAYWPSLVNSKMVNITFTNTGYVEHWLNSGTIIATVGFKSMFVDMGVKDCIGGMFGFPGGVAPSSGRWVGFIYGTGAFDRTDTMSIHAWTENTSVARAYLNTSLDSGPPPFLVMDASEVNSLYAAPSFPDLTGMFVSTVSASHASAGRLTALIALNTPIAYTTITTNGSTLRTSFARLRMTCVTSLISPRLANEFEVTNQGLRCALWNAYFYGTSDPAVQTNNFNVTCLGHIDNAGFTGVSSNDTMDLHPGWNEIDRNRSYERQGLIPVSTSRTRLTPDVAGVTTINSWADRTFRDPACAVVRGLFLTERQSTLGNLLMAHYLFSSVETMTPGDETRLLNTTFQFTDLSSVST